ncbi:MAG TPA: ATP-binding protein, partial [Limnobacter sp.]|uniref:ATP-binding protein n=1 Tax=Limnobacter sp. TaxID=2003368 RepID=UPI002E3317F0
RTELANSMAAQLIKPTGLDTGLRSGLFLSGIRRIGKTTFLRNDLIPALQKLGAVVVYVDLWSNPQASPADLVYRAVADTLRDLATPGSALLEKLRAIKGLDIGALGVKLGVKIEAVGKANGVTLAQVFEELIDKTQTDVVLIIDEVQHALTSDDGGNLLLALKACRDAINPRPDTPGHFIFIGTGSNRALIGELATRKNQAFAGAYSADYPVLNGEYVEFLLQQLRNDGYTGLPSQKVASEAFKTLGSRPEELLRALRLALQSHANNPTTPPDTVLPAIALTLRNAAADIELEKVEARGPLAMAIFNRIASKPGGSKGIYSAEAAEDYSTALGRTVKIEEIQPVAMDLMAANLIMRRGHGLYEITDPFIKEIWKEKKGLL